MISQVIANRTTDREDQPVDIGAPIQLANSHSRATVPPARAQGWLAMVKRFLVPLMLSTVIAAVLISGGVFSTAAPVVEQTVRPLDVNVVLAQRDSQYETKRTYLGQIESSRDSQIGFEFGGKLNAVYFDEGQTVAKNELLAELDTEILRSNFDSLTAQINSSQARLDELIAGPRKEDIGAAQAEVRRWRAQLKLAQITKDRMVSLRQSRAVSNQEVDEAVYSEQTISAQLDLAKSNLEELINGTRKEIIAAQQAALNQLQAERNTIAIQIRKSRLLAPFSGIVSSRLLDEGEVIRAGQPVFELLDHQSIEARIGLPVESAAAVTVQSQYELVCGDEKFLAKLKSVRPEKNSDTRTIDVVFELPELAHRPSIGDIVRLEMAEPAFAPGFWIPSSALVESYRGMWGCYVAENPNSASGLAISKLRELEILHQDDERTFVQGALIEGEQVIFSGIHRIVPEQSIRITSVVAAGKSSQVASSSQEITSLENSINGF